MVKDAVRLVVLSWTLTSCASAPATPTLESLMRTSYYLGCGERSLVELSPGSGRNQVEVKLKACEARSKTFDLRQTGTYRENLEVRVREPKMRER